MVIFFRSVAFALLTLVGSTSLFSQSIRTVTTKYRSADDFKTVSSYFTDGSKMGPRIVKRSQENAWNGMYFIIEFTDRPETFKKKLSVTVDVVTPFSPKPRQYTYTLPPSDIFTWESYFGITGPDWPDPSVNPLAWKISIKDFEGNLITEKQSFLWK